MLSVLLCDADLINMFLMQYSYCDTCGGVCVFYAGQVRVVYLLLAISRLACGVLSLVQ